MERPERKDVGFWKQPLENERYNKAMKEYNEWFELEKDRIRLDNERLKLENEEKRALVEGLRKKHDIGGTEKMYDRVKNEKIEKPKSFIEKLNDLFNS